MKKLFILIALFVSVQSFAQIETDTHVFWQPGACFKVLPRILPM